VSVEGNFSQLAFTSPLNSTLIINLQNVWCRFLRNRSMFGLVCVCVCVCVSIDVQLECSSECTVNVMSRPGVEQCARCNKAHQSNKTLLNEWHSTLLHVSISKESTSTFQAHPICKFFHYSLGRSHKLSFKVTQQAVYYSVARAIWITFLLKAKLSGQDKYGIGGIHQVQCPDCLM
jgi:hypothetical protein